MPNRRGEHGGPGKEEDLALPKQALPVPILKRAKPIRVRHRPPLIQSTTAQIDDLVDDPQTATLVDRTKAPATETRLTESLKGPPGEAVQRLQLHSQIPETWHRRLHPYSTREWSDHATDVRTQTAADCLSPPLASDSYLQCQRSERLPTKAATLPSAPDLTPYQVRDGSISHQDLGHPRTRTSHSEANLAVSGGGSKAWLSRRRSERKRLSETEASDRPRVLEETLSKPLSTGDRLKQTQSQSLQLNSTSSTLQDPTNSKLKRLQLRHQTARPHIREDLELSTTRTQTMFGVSGRNAAFDPSTAEKVIGVCADIPNRPAHHYPTACTTHGSPIRSHTKKPYHPSTSSRLAEHRSRTERSGRRSASSGSRFRAEHRRSTSAPPLLRFPHVPTAIDLTPAKSCRKMTSTCIQTALEQVDSVEGTPHLQAHPGKMMLGRLREIEDQQAHHRPRLHPTLANGITRGTAGRLSKGLDQEEGTSPPRPFIDRSSVESFPTYECGSCSDLESEEDAGRETPLTSPCTSPVKLWSDAFRRTPWESGMVQLDGPRNSSDEDHAPVGARSESQSTADREQVDISRALDSFHVNETTSDVESADQTRYFSSIERFADWSSEQDPYGTALAVDETDYNADEATPLVTPSPAKGAKGFPFPGRANKSMPERVLSRVRHPSALLKHCEGLASGRQRQMMNSGVRTPDRFIPLRTATPTKDSLFLTKPVPKLSISKKGNNRRSPPADPFGPTPRRSLRLTEQFATVRTPPPPMRPSGLRTSLVETPTRRSASAGAVWSVGGTTTTEGVASITNGRGGRVTSGTSAPHYAADFLRRNTPSEEEVTHGRRLAFAMDIDQSARMLDHSLPSSPGSANSVSSEGQTSRVWRNAGWESKTSPLTPTRIRPRKTKDIPIIPFRVLNAPALRDDYYCSLLAHSPTVNCLAVGLGAQVYLWTEKKDRGSSIPDSLTVPLGTAHVTSISFSSVEGGCAILAIGRADGRITLWSPLDTEPRFDSEQPSPISCVCFRTNTVQRSSVRDPIATVPTEELLVGDEVGFVYYYSIEWPDKDKRDLFNWHGSMTLLARITCHSQQICGLAWSPDGTFFATGGNDNQMHLFETKKALKHRPHLSNYPSVRVRGPSSESSTVTVAGQREVITITPGHEKHTFSLNAAVKAIAFAPWQPTLLAVGGGSNDRCIHFFHTLSGATLATIDCHAQVTSLVWSTRRKELAATFGFAQPEHPHRVAVFAWPSCDMVVKIPWYTEERALFAVAYPRGPSSGVAAEKRSADAEGRPWYGRRTKEEGCLVVATSDASIKFHEIWAERREGEGRRVVSGALGGSQILEGECSEGIERRGVIR